MRLNSSTVAAAPALEELSLAPSLGYSLIGQVIFLLSQLIILATLTRVQGTGAVGELGIALAFTTPFFLFVNMGGRSSQASDIGQRYSFAEYAGLVLSLAAFATVGSTLTGLLFSTSEQVLLITLIVAVMKIFESINSLAYGAFQQAGRSDLVSASLILRAVVTVPLFVTLLWAGAPLALALLSQLFVWSAVAVLRDYPLASRVATGDLVRPSTDLPRLFTLARETAPLGAGYAVNALLTSLPRIVVERALGLSAVGALTVVGYFQQAGSVLISAMSQPLINRFARLRQRMDSSGIRSTGTALLAVVTALSAAGVILVGIAGKWVLVTIFGPDLAHAADLLMLIALALSAQLFSVVPQSLLHADRRYRTFLLREIATVLICALLLAQLVPVFGLIGAGYAIVGSALFRLSVLVIAVTLFPAKRLRNSGPLPATKRAT